MNEEMKAINVTGKNSKLRSSINDIWIDRQLKSIKVGAGCIN